MHLAQAIDEDVAVLRGCFIVEPGGIGNPQRKIIACRAIMELTMSACAVVRQLRERP